MFEQHAIQNKSSQTLVLNSMAQIANGGVHHGDSISRDNTAW